MPRRFAVSTYAFILYAANERSLFPRNVKRRFYVRPLTWILGICSDSRAGVCVNELPRTRSNSVSILGQLLTKRVDLIICHSHPSHLLATAEQGNSLPGTHGLLHELHTLA